MKAVQIHNGMKVIDSRDVIARISELESEVEDLKTAAADDGEEFDPECCEEAQELKALLALAEEGEGSADWRHGETLIHEDYFTEYAQELAEDIGTVNKAAEWPNSYIDWEAAAEALKQDYTMVDYGDQTYYIRA